MAAKGHDPFALDRMEDSEKAFAQKAKQRQAQRTSDLKWLLNGRRGRRIVYDMLEDAGVFRSSFSTNAMEMAFNEGMRDKGLHLTQFIMQTCPEHWTTMNKENTEDGS